MIRFIGHFFMVVLATVLVGCAHSPPYNPQDPLQPVNRAIFKFNRVADEYVTEPIARGYVSATPSIVRTGISNFVSNVREPITIANDILQLKMVQAASDVARLVINTVFGVAGLVDMATGLGLEAHDEDFGQTLGYWGVGQGIYLVLPFLGPTTGRDFVGRVADVFTDPIHYVDDTTIRLSFDGLYLLSKRASLLGIEETIQSAFDPYSFVRGGYLQHRRNVVHDGHPPRLKPLFPVPASGE